MLIVAPRTGREAHGGNIYQMDQNQIDLLWQIKNAIRNYFLYSGGPRLLVNHEEDTYCTDCARVIFRELVECVRDGHDVEVDIHNEGEPIHCCGCGEVIEPEFKNGEVIKIVA